MYKPISTNQTLSFYCDSGMTHKGTTKSVAKGWFKDPFKFMKLAANILIATALGLCIFSAVQIGTRLNELCGSLDTIYYCQTVSIPSYNGYVNVIDSIMIIILKLYRRMELPK